jgi:hypothetical protein
MGEGFHLGSGTMGIGGLPLDMGVKPLLLIEFQLSVLRK